MSQHNGDLAATPLSSSMPTSRPTQRIGIGRIWWVGLLALTASAGANLAIRAMAVPLLAIPAEFTPVAVPNVVRWTIIGVVAATIVFAVVARYAQDPISLFRKIALAALLLSFIPDVGLLVSNVVPGTSVAAVGTLMTMHVITAAITLGLLTTLPRRG